MRPGKRGGVLKAPVDFLVKAGEDRATGGACFIADGDHIVIPSSFLEKVKHTFGLVLEKPSLIISFVENKDRVQSNFGHLGFQVETPDELNQKLADAKGKNLVSKEEIGTNCCYAKQDKFWVNDPDNVQWEVYYFHADAEFNDPHYDMGEASACCTVSTTEVKSQSPCLKERCL